MNTNPDHYTFDLAEGVKREKAHFHNRFGIELTGDLYMPSNPNGMAIAISGPFGAVKEQASGYWANHLASLGFLTLAFDPSFTGESGGTPRYVSSPDINTDDFSAAVDYLISRGYDRVGVIGICGWGGIAINAASLDPRIKATLAVTMYDIHRVTANGYFDQADTKEARDKMREAFAEQRTRDYASGSYKRGGGVVDPLPDDAPQFVKDYYDYYKTARGYSARSLNSNEGWNATSPSTWLNAPIMAYADEIDNAVMVLHGENAHSRYFGEDAFKRLKGDNKRLVIVPGANHTDLYDGGPDHNMIPWQTVIDFFTEYLK